MDATFHKLMPLYEGEKYDGNFEEKRKVREAKAKKLITSDPWKPSQPMKQSSGLGDYYGCMGKHKHIGGGAEANRLKKGDPNLGGGRGWINSRAKREGRKEAGKAEIDRQTDR